MTIESLSTLAFLLISWILLTILNVSVSGILHFLTSISFRKAFLWGLLSLAIPPVMMLYGILIERNIYKVNDLEIAFKDLPVEFDGYRIVHISDIHARSFGNRPEQLKKAVDKINGLKPDLIAFTGDLITMNSSELDGVSEILGSLKAKDGVMSVLGNHDYCIYSDPKIKEKDSVDNLITKERALGWNLLLDESMIISRGLDSIAVVGVENTTPSDHFPSKGDLEKAGKGTEGMFRILLSHDPMHWEMEVIGKGYPLMLSGHTHAMQFTLFGWKPSKYIFRQHSGHYVKDSCHLYVNIGLGETIIPIRIGAMPEITLLTLKTGNNH